MNEAKKKAIELVERFVYSDKKEFPRLKTKNQAKKDALICVDLILSLSLCEDCNEAVERYWTEVKLELTK